MVLNPCQDQFLRPILVKSSNVKEEKYRKQNRAHQFFFKISRKNFELNVNLLPACQHMYIRSVRIHCPIKYSVCVWCAGSSLVVNFQSLSYNFLLGSKVTVLQDLTLKQNLDIFPPKKSTHARTLFPDNCLSLKPSKRQSREHHKAAFIISSHFIIFLWRHNDQRMLFRQLESMW